MKNKNTTLYARKEIINIRSKNGKAKGRYMEISTSVHYHWIVTFCMREVYYSHVYVMSIYNLENIEIVQWSVIDLVLILFLVLIYCFNMSKSYQYYKVMEFFSSKICTRFDILYFPIMSCINQTKVTVLML